MQFARTKHVRLCLLPRPTCQRPYHLPVRRSACVVVVASSISICPTQTTHLKQACLETRYGLVFCSVRWHAAATFVRHVSRFDTWPYAENSFLSTPYLKLQSRERRSLKL